jgi:hypothetical protein
MSFIITVDSVTKTISYGHWYAQKKLDELQTPDIKGIARVFVGFSVVYWHGVRDEPSDVRNEEFRKQRNEAAREAKTPNVATALKTKLAHTDEIDLPALKMVSFTNLAAQCLVAERLQQEAAKNSIAPRNMLSGFRAEGVAATFRKMKTWARNKATVGLELRPRFEILHTHITEDRKSWLIRKHNPKQLYRLCASHTVDPHMPEWLRRGMTTREFQIHPEVIDALKEKLWDFPKRAEAGNSTASAQAAGVLALVSK